MTPYFYIYDEFGNRHYPNIESVQQFARITDRYLPRYPDEAAEQFEADRNLLLDAVDFVLGRFQSGAYQAEPVSELNSQLAEARSAYVAGVGANGRYELQDRQPEELTKLITDATAGGDRAAEHLRRAWSKSLRSEARPYRCLCGGCGCD